ncbi:MAG: Druantia anti-phage system protein DruA [Bacillota bacterium]
MNNDFSLDTRPLVGKLKDLRLLDIRLVNKTSWEPVWGFLARRYHYLGYDKMFGPRIKYLVFHKERPIAALSFNRAALTVGVRDAFLGWKPTQKQKLLPQVVNNNRFLILPWVRVRNLASHLLACAVRLLMRDWPARLRTLRDLFGTLPRQMDRLRRRIWLIESFSNRCRKATITLPMYATINLFFLPCRRWKCPPLNPPAGDTSTLEPLFHR